MESRTMSGEQWRATAALEARPTHLLRRPLPPRAPGHETPGEPPGKEPCAREEDGMKSSLAAIIGLVIMIFASPATAHVVEVTTSIPVTTAADDAQLKDALESAINDVLHHAIAFTPTGLSASKGTGRWRRPSRRSSASLWCRSSTASRRRCARPSCRRSWPSRRGWSCWAGLRSP
jgi:hypothetical protein